MKKLFKIGFALATCLSLTACSLTPKEPNFAKFTVIGKVVNSEKTPEICKEMTSSGRPILGAIIGGAVGNQFGSGNGRKAMTGVGVLAGAIAGHQRNKKFEGKMKCKSEFYDTTLSFLNPIDNSLEIDAMVTSKRKYKGVRIYFDYYVALSSLPPSFFQRNDVKYELVHK